MRRAQKYSTSAWGAGRGGEGRTWIARQAGAIALGVGVSAALFWVVWLSDIGLRDARYLDGWLLAAGMGLQLYFHIAIKTGRLSPKAAARWRKIHIWLGYVLVAAFISHSDFSRPDTVFEWVLTAGFALVALSGFIGTYIAWSTKARHGIDASLTFDQIPARRAKIARAVEAAVTPPEPPAADFLPAPPYDTWIADLYVTRLRDFLAGPRNFAAHLVGSHRPLKQLVGEIDELARFLDNASQDRLAAIRRLIVEKNHLDVASVHLGLGEAWLLVHVPVTYALVTLSVLHILVVYAFTSRPW